MVPRNKPDYGQDAPTLMRNFALFGLAGVAFGFFWTGGFWFGGAFLFTALFGVFGSRILKLGKRDKVLDALELRGDERALDVGCGRGLLLIGLAKRLPNGHVDGIDLWQSVDQSGNDPEATLRNARLEGVEERIAITTGDMRKLPYGDATFEVATASWAIHNVPTREGRAEAIREIWRVLKPGGKILIVDIEKVGEYVVTFRELGAEPMVGPPTFEFLTPTRVLSLIKS